MSEQDGGQAAAQLDAREHSDSRWHLVLVKLEEVVALEVLKLEALAAVQHLCTQDATCQAEADCMMLSSRCHGMPGHSLPRSLQNRQVISSCTSHVHQYICRCCTSSSVGEVSFRARFMQLGSQFMRFLQLRTTKGAPCSRCCCARLQHHTVVSVQIQTPHSSAFRVFHSRCAAAPPLDC